MQKVPDPLREPGFLTEHQLRAVSAGGDVFLTACPGSGKTRAAGVRVARLAQDGLRVAACSYTNVGVEQIRRVLTHDLRQPLDSRHFTGTLHGFLLRYVLYPYGHLVTGSTGSPRLVGDEAIAQEVVFDPKTRLALSRFRFRPDGSLVVRSTPPKFRFDAEQAAQLGQQSARNHKLRIAKNGIVSFDDAMYWSLRVFVEYPDLARAVAGRFDEVLVDEAQDTSELQLACLRQLCSTDALRSLFLVGDLEQSISAYTGASRSGCEALAASRGLAPLDFEENHRASQRLCDVAVHFCARTSSDRAVGPDRHCEIEPQLVLYPAKDPAAAVSHFRTRLEELAEDPSQAAVLARSNALVDELNGTTSPVHIRPRPMAVGRAISAFRGGGTVGRRQLEAIDRIIAFTAWDITDTALLDADARWVTRRATMRLLQGAPDIDLNLRTFVRGCASVLGQVVSELTGDPAHKAGQVLASAREHEDHQASDVFVPSVTELRAQTVHDIKGESRSSVLVVVDRLRSRKHAAQASLWSRPLKGETVDPKDAEELRIAFVALTRARRYCLVALPDNSGADVIAAFEEKGFRQRHSAISA